MGKDIARVRHGLASQQQTEALRVRLLERDDVTPVALPPWAIDPARGECTTLVLLAPVPTQFILHVHPWPGLPGVLASSAGALQLTRCGRERASMLQMLIEMRSPRAVLHALVAVGSAPPAPLLEALPERDTGPAAPPGDPGPAPPRPALAERLQQFELSQRQGGALSVETRALPRSGWLRLSLAPGCHQLLVAQPQAAADYVVELREAEHDEARRLEPSERGDVREELCTARERPIWLALEVPEKDRRASASEPEPQVAVATFPLPLGLPGRFGPEVAERLARALGGSHAPRRVGPVVVATLGAQGRTPLPRRLLPNHCYVAVATALHGETRALSLGVQAGSDSAQATSEGDAAGPRLGFCTGMAGTVELDVEARGLGVAWLALVFHMGPARSESP